MKTVHMKIEGLSSSPASELSTSMGQVAAPVLDIAENTVDCTVVIPTYNEVQTIVQLIDRVLVYPLFRIIVVDDNSPDGTGSLVNELSGYGPRLQLISRPMKMGLGSAYLSGFRKALDEGARFIFEMDADFSHDPDALLTLLAAAEAGCDLVVGSRYVRGGCIRDWGLLRQLISRGGNLYARSVLGLETRDCTSGFRCYRREVVEQLCAGVIGSNGYSFQIETLYRSWKSGFRVGEAPIEFPDRRVGYSKMTRKDVLEAIIRVWQLGCVDDSVSKSAVVDSDLL